MLKGIPKIISPELLKVLMEMGHGDEIVLADGNFPAASHGSKVIRCDGNSATEILESILELFPIDTYTKHPIALMEVVKGDPVETPIWDEYESIIAKQTSIESPFEYVERFAFYDRAKNAYAIIATGEKALYANIILKKGVISE
ncbi:MULTISPECIES: L-fucose mutarotase [Metabacillus]|uniref:Fucose isomerase n=2 Tax=Metabacillus TaxID=2675233 RepID=A0A179T9K0_9BACI|nr:MULTISPECIES: L-fucose mutarotase [Metabacillus]OAS89082.1 fucose isomerase [Metabacillus litoralis]QNF28598.1 L-fucose mutarotase [Metabacillus sp. KUDC1714]